MVVRKLTEPVPRLASRYTLSRRICWLTPSLTNIKTVEQTTKNVFQSDRGKSSSYSVGVVFTRIPHPNPAFLRQSLPCPAPLAGHHAVHGAPSSSVVRNLETSTSRPYLDTSSPRNIPWVKLRRSWRQDRSAGQAQAPPYRLWADPFVCCYSFHFTSFQTFFS